MNMLAVYAVGALVLAGAGYAIVTRYNNAIERATVAEQKSESYKAQLSDLREARRKEQETARLDAEASALVIRENENARLEIEDLRARLAAGTVRVRERFRCPAASVPGTAAAASGSDAADEHGLRGADADFLIRFAGEADTATRRLKLCQDALSRSR